MIEEMNFSMLVEPAINWFLENRRNLPWRQDMDPYHIWVSEIMLQQTRVEAVKSYYARFMQELPTVEALANCPETKLLKLWEGLGYYNRVRNMQRAAEKIQREYHGRMPETYEEILALPGIGPYTAGAIAATSFNVPSPAVDGNVLRIISRVTDDERDILKESTKKLVAGKLREVMPDPAMRGWEEIIPPNGTFNQALMEIGALVCVPNGDPHCEVCPWNTMCLAKCRGTISTLPVKKKQKPRKIVDMTVFLIRDGEKVLIRRRPPKGLLAGLYEFPNQEGFLSEDEAVAFVREHGLDPLRVEPTVEAKHIFSHVEWHMKGYVIRVASMDEWETRETEGEEFLVELKEMEKTYAFPTAFSAYQEIFRNL